MAFGQLRTEKGSSFARVVVIQDGRPTERTLSSIDVRAMEQWPRILLDVTSGLETSKVAESVATLYALKQFFTSCGGDGKKSKDFLSKKRPPTRSSVQYGLATRRSSLSSYDFTDMECVDVRSFREKIKVESTAYPQAPYTGNFSCNVINGRPPANESERFKTIPHFLNATDLLNNLETTSICYKVLLNRIQLTYKNKETKGSKREQLDDLQCAIYEALQIIKELQYLAKEHFQSRKQEIFEYINRLEYVGKVVRKIQKETELILNKDKDRCIETVRVCSLLGLRLEFLDHLEEISPRIRNHRSVSEWIVTFLRENYESRSSSEKASLSRKLLVSIGFDSMSSSVETVLARSRAGNMQQHIEPCEWAEIFLEDEFKYNFLLSPQADKFPFQSDLINTWFQHSTENKNGESIHVRTVNLVTEECETSGTTACSRLYDVLRELEQEQHVVLFHGTDHDSAKGILVGGIDLSAGRQKRDFSCGLGFYLTKNCSDALNWAKSITAKPAILMFYVKRDCFDKFRKQIFLETSPDDMIKWHKVVSSCRTGKLTAEIQKVFTEFDFMEGPKAIIKGRNEADEFLFEPKPSSHQICLFAEDLANVFHENLHSILFFGHRS